jgi:hypothetical protein
LESSTVIPLRGSSLTFSAWVKRGSTALTGTLSFSVYYSTSSDAYGSLSTPVTVFPETISPSTSWIRRVCTFTVPSDAVGLKVGIIPTDVQASGVVVYFAGMQLERGYFLVTPFEQRPIGTELALCQRYFQRHSVDNSNTYIAAVTGSGSGFIQIPLITQMRATPTFSASSGSALRPLTTGGSIIGTTNTTSIALTAGAQPHAALISFSGSSGLSAGTSIAVSGNANAYFDFFAEL